MSKTIIITFCQFLQLFAPSFVHTANLFEEMLSAGVPDKIEFKNATSCLGPLGCFNTDWPFYDIKTRPVSVLPFNRKQLNVRFQLYTRKNKVDFELISEADGEGLRTSNFNPEHKTYFFIHGFIDNAVMAKWIKDVRVLTLVREDCNVIIVDWGRANRFPYFQAVANTRAVGAETALLITTLQAVLKADPEKMHVLGHSLGAHTAGYVGKRIKNLGRITGLDPAGPFYTGTDSIVRLDPSDAKFVDVIHSDASLNIVKGLGTTNTVGHVDFFPNNGNDQPGCLEPIIGIGTFQKLLAKGLVEGTRQTLACDHQRAVTLLTSTINTKKCLMVGLACTSWKDFLEGKCGDCGEDGSRCAVMGMDGDKFYKGNENFSIGRKYYMLTSGDYPFCLYHFHVTLVLDDNANARKIRGIAQITIYGTKAKIEQVLTRRSEIFKPGGTHTYMVTSKRQIGDFDKADFSWDTKEASHSDATVLGIGVGYGGHESENARGANLYVKSLRISPLIMPSSTELKLGPRTLCGDGVTLVPPKTTVTLSLNKKC